MNKKDLVKMTDLAGFADQVRANRPSEHGHHGHDAPVESQRTDSYAGHEIVVRTTYRIEVDGRPVTGHVGVGNDGQVHYHPLPNYSFSSALDLVHQLIDTFPDDFPPPKRRAKTRRSSSTGPADHHGHGH